MATADIEMMNLRGGMNDTDPQPALPDNQVPLAMNVEWFQSTFGERRAGCEELSLSGTTLTNMTAAVFGVEWFPTNSVFDPELVVIFAEPGGSHAPIAYKRLGSVSGSPAWTSITIPSGSAILETQPDIYQIRAQSLNGFLFLAYNSGHDRLHYYDNSTWQVTGLAEPGVPSLGSSGSGSMVGTRYYRYRVAQLSGSTIVRLSEPSDSASITPTGKDTVTITQGTLPNEGETHWIIEGSDDDSDFYELATVAIGTTTYDDHTVDPTSFQDAGELSAAIGAYLTQPSFRFLANDGDRLLGAGNWNDLSLASTVYWSPASEDPGVANSQRQPIVTTGGTDIVTSLSLDNYAGGPLTGISNAVNGNWYAFKWQRIYMLSRTQDFAQAYTAITLSTQRGAIPGSIFQGADEAGQPCIYFLDPTFGPSRIGTGGVMTMEGLRNTWQRVNLEANHVIATGLFYNYKRQAHWWLAADGADEPNLKFVNQTSNTQWQGTAAVTGGWSLADGTITEALYVTTYTEWVIEGDGSITLSQRPFIFGTDGDSPRIARCDAGDTDMGDEYESVILTKPYIQAGLLNWWGAMAAGLLATASEGHSIKVRIIRDFGLETSEAIEVDLSPEEDETYVFRLMDQMKMSHAHSIQIRISDS
jgi:hypothetical protein